MQGVGIDAKRWMALVARHQNKESKAIKVIVAGAAGRMGARLISLIDESKTFQLTGAVERKGHDAIGQDVGELAGCARLGISLSDDVTDEVLAVIRRNA